MGEAKNYDLCINSSRLGVDGTVKILKAFIDVKESIS